jgi:LuxR family maltose regulon positive regulatory protein
MVISTREDLPESIPLPRLRARRQVTEVRDRDLRFSTEEIGALFNQAMGLSLSADIVRALESRTEGWIAGLQLAALALQEGQADAEAFVDAFAGDDRHVFDYLVAEVLQRQPEATRDFLRRTAILDRMTASLCNAVTGREDGHEMLDRLEGSNLLISLDNRREWYRYHRLFAGALRATLSGEEERTLHGAASRWYEAQGLVSQAIRHALASKDYDGAERLIRFAAEEIMQGGNILTVRHWLDALPDERVRGDGTLAFYRGWTLSMTGELALAEEYISAAEACFRRDKAADADWGKLQVFRGFVAVLVHRDYERGIELATDALRLLGDARTHWHVIALWTLAEASERTQNIARAIDTLREAREAGLAFGENIFAVVVEGALTKALNDHGRRREALAICEEAIRRFTDGGRASLLVGHLFTWMGVLAYEANQLELSREYHEKAIALNEQIGLDYDFASSHGLSAPTLYAMGEVDAALEALLESYQAAIRGKYADPGFFLAWEAHIRLREGDVAFARRWAKKAGLSSDGEPAAFGIESHLVYGRLLLAEGKLTEARAWLDRLAALAEENGLYRCLISIRIQQALAAERGGERSAAREHLTQAVEAAAPEDYVRAFLDEDPQALVLLQDVRRAAPAFVDRLLNYAREVVLEERAGSQPLIEPLSERELEVLGLIAAGLSNREIADRLVIAAGTVKRHINNIYGKLDVHSRTQAVARVRELGLI